MVDDFLGKYLVTIDEKSRIILPTSSMVTKGEQFIIVNSTMDNENVLRLYGKVNYLEILKRYIELRNNSQTEEDYIRFTQKIEEIYLSIEKVNKVDSYRRIVLPSTSVKHCNLENYAQVIGLGNAILVRKPKNASF